ncbi:MAG: hypothetical protein HOV80_19585 [Polyangiaceae bacterium]|nr:hypothetical protein [Polyangiaceae bacterium]
MRPLLAAFAALALAACFNAPRYDGPPVAGFDGKRFSNLAPYRQKDLADLIEWKLECGAAPWPDFVERAEGPRPPARVRRGIRIQMVNHATVLIQMDGLNILSDPIWSERASPFSFVGPARHKAPGIAIEHLPHIDLIVVSHNHYDHMDVPTLRLVSERDAPVVFAGLGNAKLLRDEGISGARDLGWWDWARVGEIDVWFTPAQHWSARGASDAMGTLWGSFYFKGVSGSVYFAGDTAAGPHFKMIRDHLGPPTIALLPIGAYEPRHFMAQQHLNPPDAVRAHLTLGSTQSFGIHWGTFSLTDEGMNAPKMDLMMAGTFAGLHRGAFVALENGDAYISRDAATE